jgi:CRISPR-associated protein Cas2
MILVSYDFASDNTRTKFSKFLEKYGRRIQYSVFEINNSPRVLKNILEEVKLLYKKKFQNTDSVLIYQICEGCQKKIVRYGYAVNEGKDVLIFK